MKDLLKPIYTIDNLIKLAKQKNPESDEKLLREAYEFAKKAHRGQLRASGDPYITHPLMTAKKLAEIGMTDNMIAAGLLHDVPEDTEYSLAEVEVHFGQDIQNLVKGITKLSKIKYRGYARYIENLRKMIMAMAQDIRVIIIKCADRIHNLQTLNHLPKAKQERIARESLEIFAPIANRLGVNLYQSQLELLAFKYVYPKDYKWIQNILQNKKTEQKRIQMEKDINLLRQELNKENIKYLELYGRSKHPYSLYRKLLRKNRDIKKIYDLIAMRIIVPTVADCYITLGLIHQIWKPLTGRIKDYIAQPKVNGYQSLHTTVFDKSGMITEIQIRTPEMHEKAELGIAAHWLYHEKNQQRKMDKSHQQWLAQLQKWQKEIKHNPKAIDNMKIEMFNNRCYVFTPRGDVIELPEEATPVDFAYNIHTEIGNTCEGAFVNGKYVPLDTKLKNGDMVEIITNKNRKGPNQNWLNFVKTKVARTNIKQNSKSKFMGLFSKNKKKKQK